MLTHADVPACSGTCIKTVALVVPLRSLSRAERTAIRPFTLQMPSTSVATLFVVCLPSRKVAHRKLMRCRDKTAFWYKLLPLTPKSTQQRIALHTCRSV